MSPLPFRRSRSGRPAARPDEVPVRLYGLSRVTTTAMTLVSVLFALFVLAPLVWLFIASTKSQTYVYYSSGFWFAGPFRLFQNIKALGQDVSGAGTYLTWLWNTLLYAVLGGIGCTAISALAGYGFARFRFRGSGALFSVVMSTLLVPISALALPLFLVYAKVGLVNSIWGMILPSLVSPIGVFLMRSYIDASVPADLVNAARIDGAGEIRIFCRIVLPLTVPGLVTVLLLTVVAVWNNYFLPLLIFNVNTKYPLTVGLGLWSNRAVNSGNANLYPMLVVGGLVTIVPLIALFLILQRYWRGGMLLGSIAN